jgi:hypothetical protein
VRNLSNYAIKGSCGRDCVIDVDPLRDENTRSRKLGHYLLETTPLIPPHLRQRFNSLIDTFTSTNRSTYRGSIASKVPAQSARLVERGFRFGDQDINVLLLLRGVKKVLYDNSLVALNRSVGEGFRTRAITTPSMFEVCGSLIYMSCVAASCAKRPIFFLFLTTFFLEQAYEEARGRIRWDG